MDTVFWDACGIIYIDYLEKGQTITGEYYVLLLRRLSEEMKKKRPHLKKKKILFYQNSAWVHICAVSMPKFMDLKFELLQHLPYSPDLAPSDYKLFFILLFLLLLEEVFIYFYLVELGIDL